MRKYRVEEIRKNPGHFMIVETVKMTGPVATSKEHPMVFDSRQDAREYIANNFGQRITG
jgi:hypothetical protein